MFKTSLVSSIFGKFASIEFPIFFQYIINKIYVISMKVDMGEFHNISQYKSLSALFTRGLITKRVFNQDKNNLISPCDGFISEAGKIQDGTAFQIKGFSYSVRDLLGDKIKNEAKERLDDGKYINFYLSPKDYHHYHAPIDMKVEKAIHIPGKLYPVNFKWLQKVPNLFIENERVVLECKTEEDRLFYMVFVGALNVGKMSFVFDERIKTNVNKSYETYYEYGDISLKKGEELGKFDMGSTIIMLFEKNLVKLTCNVNSKVNFGEDVAVI